MVPRNSKKNDTKTWDARGWRCSGCQTGRAHCGGKNTKWEQGGLAYMLTATPATHTHNQRLTRGTTYCNMHKKKTGLIISVSSKRGYADSSKEGMDTVRHIWDRSPSVPTS